MKFYYLAFLLLFFTACSSNTEQIPTEEVIDVGENTEIITEKVTEFDSITGQNLEYFIDKKTKLKHGLYTAYNNNILEEEINYENGKKNGVQKLYHSNGQLNDSSVYVNDLLEGPFKVFDQQGILIQQGERKKDLIIGELKNYYPNGQDSTIVTFVEGRESGPFKEYYKTGVLKTEGTYTTDEKGTAIEDDILLQYDEKGNLYAKRFYLNGISCQVWNKKEGDKKGDTELCAQIIKAYHQKYGSKDKNI